MGRIVTLPAHLTADWLPAHLAADWLLRDWNTRGQQGHLQMSQEEEKPLLLYPGGQARPSVQMRNAWHTLLLHPQSFTNVYTDGLVYAPLRHFCKQGRLGFSSNKELGIVQFL